MAAASGGTLPPLVMPELPDIQTLSTIVATPGGAAAAIYDLYGHVRQMGHSVQSI